MDTTTMKKSDTELFAQDTSFPESSRIDIIGQNGNEGLHYKSKFFAIQSLFSYGWDYIGYDDEDGLREVFKTEQKANKEIKEILELTKESPDEWKVVPYNPHEDDSFARF